MRHPSSNRTQGIHAAALALALLLPAAAATAPAAAASPGAGTQAPGYWHQAVGRLRVTALFDGVVELGRDELSNVDPARKASLIERGFVPETPKGLQTAVNAYLVEAGGHRVLVDAGTAQCFGPGLGQVPANLRAAGYDPAQVEVVLLTHAHPDHMCGLVDAAGKPVYSNATVWLSQRDADYWLDPATESKPGTRALYKPLFKMARDAVVPYRAAGRLHLFADGEALPDGARALPSHGHTPGHTSFLFNAGGAQQVLVWGDIVHYHSVQFADPSAAYEADADRDQAIASRRDLLARAADGRWWLAGAHLPFPGIGHVRREGEGYAWVPAEYGPLPPASP